MRKAIDGATLIKGKLVRGWYQGQERVMQMAKAAKEGICGDSGILVPAIVYTAFLKRFKSKYSDPSFRGMLGTRNGAGSGSCPANLGLHEVEGEGTSRSS